MTSYRWAAGRRDHWASLKDCRWVARVSYREPTISRESNPEGKNDAKPWDDRAFRVSSAISMAPCHEAWSPGSLKPKVLGLPQVTHPWGTLVLELLFGHPGG